MDTTTNPQAVSTYGFMLISQLSPAHASLAENIISRQIGASSPAVSPDGKHVAYVVTRVDWIAQAAAHFGGNIMVGPDLTSAEA